MRATFLCTALLAGLALPAAASEGVDLSIKSKSMAASSTEMLSKSAPAPFLRQARDPMPEHWKVFDAIAAGRPDVARTAMEKLIGLALDDSLESRNAT